MDFPLKPVIDFGTMPIANAFLNNKDQFKDEFFYQMVVGYDPATHAIGLVNTVPPEKMFHDHYAFFSSASTPHIKHFRDAAEKLLSLAKGGMVVEIGSNDGIMLESWKELGVRAVGIEPSANVAEVSTSRGHEVIVKFMTPEVVDEILAKGRVSLVFGAQVTCHIEGFRELMQCITRLIGKDGAFVFEDPYFLDIVEKTSYDQVYDEHLWYFTVSFINKVLEPLGFHVFDAEHLDVFGGSLRMYVGHKDTHPAKPTVSGWLAKETDLPGKLALLNANIAKSKEELLNILHRVKKDGKRICGFGATSKATTVFNYCGIGPDLIPFVTDNTPAKQGKLYPGVHIPVVPQEEFKDVDYAFLGAWNLADAIVKSQARFTEGGGKWITHVPMPRIM
ncbi:MAG: hypothetical protein RL681_825 [Candidatus Parcubacteria bacterium]|jgi:methylation protein EvaC